MDKIRDIKPNIVIDDYSFYIFLFVVIVVLLICVFGVILSYKKYKKTKKTLYIFNLKNPKQSAYTLLKIIHNKEESKTYIEKLHTYTYKKNVPEFDEKLFYEIVDKYQIKYKVSG